MYLLTTAKAKALKERAQVPVEIGDGTGTGGGVTQPEVNGGEETPSVTVTPSAGRQKLRLCGAIPSEVWNRLGTKLIPKLKSSANLRLGLDFTFELEDRDAQQFVNDLKQTLADLGLAGSVKVEPA